jgi:hypothetical protein
MNVSIDDMIKCINRELAYRRNLYPIWVKNKRMKPEVAEHEIEMMESILNLLTSLSYHWDTEK